MINSKEEGGEGLGSFLRCSFLFSNSFPFPFLPSALVYFSFPAPKRIPQAWACARCS